MQFKLPLSVSMTLPPKMTVHGSHCLLKTFVAIGVTVVMGTLAGCGGGPGAGAQPYKLPSTADIGTTKGIINDEVQFLYDYMQDWYLFYKDLPQINLSQFQTPEDALNSLRVVKDKFSNITSDAAATALFDEGRLLAFGISTKIENDSQIKIRFVQPNSPALAAGIQRGDAITAIDGKTVAALIASGEIDNAYGPQEDGVTRTFSISRGTQNLDIPVSKTWFTIDSAPVTTVHSVGTAKAGYILYNQFTNPSLIQWRSAITTIKAQGATKIIVDLRFNGGGLVDIGAALAGSLTPVSASGKLYSMIEFNDKHYAQNEPINVAADSAAGSFDEVIFLTSPGTCSASEGLIVGIQPYLDATKITIIGETTCGKPVGFTAPSYKGKRYNVLSFRGKNATGFTDYFDGLTPKCVAVDAFAGNLGQAGEAMLDVALNYLTTGTCPSLSADSPQTKEAATGNKLHKNAADYWRLPVNGLARETGIQ
jgi:carboxyl-terminal processing protease